MFDQLFIENSISSVGVNPQGGYVTSWRVNGTDVLYVGSVIKRTGIPVLFPYFGRSEKLPMHGFGRDCLWRVTIEEKNHVRMELGTDDVLEERREEYPYLFECFIDVFLEESGDFVYTLWTKNVGEFDMPISPGLHPYWSVAQEDKKELSIEGISGFDAGVIDWDSNPPDTLYSFSGKATVHLPNKKSVVIEELSEGECVVKYLCVWSQGVDKEDFNFVCVEPVCGEQYGIDRNPIIVKPGEEWEMKMRFSFLP